MIVWGKVISSKLKEQESHMNEITSIIAEITSLHTHTHKNA